MQLRFSSPRHPALLLGALLVALALLCGRASGGAPEYPSPLYLGGAASSLIGSSYQLVASAGVGATARPTPTAAPCGLCVGGNLTSGGLNYSYRYTLVDAGGETPPSASVTSAPVTAQQITVGNLPTGVTVRLYRQKGSGLFNKVAELTNNASATYDDNLPDGSVGVLLPQAQNRTTVLATGWFEYQPGVALPTTATSGTFNSVASPAFDGKGWIVDGAGSVAFPAGAWSITVKIASAGTGGTARLAMGMWKVAGGAVVGSALIDPACSITPCGSGGQPGLNMAANISTAAGTASAITTSFPSMPAFSLTAGQHLYVQFYRDQTAGATGDTRSTLNTYDGVALITHQAASTLPNDPTLQTPVDTAQTNSSALTATFSDPDAGDTGTVSFRVCSASASAGSQCLPFVTSGSSLTVANGANGSWTPGPLADGTYYWQALATDATGGQSGWTATHSFTLDTAPPDTTIGTSPANPNNSTSATFSFTATEGGSTFQCQLDGGGYSACASPKSYNALADGSHTFQVKATDPAVNTDASPATSTWTVDTVAPATTITSSPANQTNATSASFSFGASKAGSTFQCQLDGGGYSACASPKSYSGLADGSHTFQVKATDPVGNTGSASFSWTVDTAAPTTTITSSPANQTNATSASFSFGASKAGSTFQCQLDAGSYSACASPKSYSGLADGSHTFQVKATDPVGNTGSASFSWTVDTTPETIVETPISPNNSSEATAGSSWTVDTTPPGPPGLFAGSAGANGLTLSWLPAAGGPIAQYVLYVNGVGTTRVDGMTTTLKLGAFGPDDTRNFSVAAVDAAGNEGPHTTVLAGIPDLVGLRLSEAGAALRARGLAIGKQTLSVPGSGALVVAQRPAAGTLASLQSTVFVTLADASGGGPSVAPKAPFVVHIAGAQTVTCTQSSRLTLQIHLDRQAKVGVRFLTAGGVPLDSARLVAVHAGSQTLRLKLPTGLSARKSYRVIVTARTGGQIVRAEIKVTIKRSSERTKSSAGTCG